MFRLTSAKLQKRSCCVESVGWVNASERKLLRCGSSSFFDRYTSHCPSYIAFNFPFRREGKMISAEKCTSRRFKVIEPVFNIKHKTFNLGMKEIELK